jgi:hypothetical protein
MSIAIRSHYEGLALGTSGTTYTITSGRFHLRSPDRAAEAGYASSAERAFEVRVDPLGHLDPPNVLDGFSFDRYRVTIRVTYALTNAGGDLTDTLAEQDGAGTLDAITDRWATDVHDLRTVVEWHENQLTSPAGILLEMDAARLTQRGQMMVGELPFVVTVKASRPGSYSP